MTTQHSRALLALAALATAATVTVVVAPPALAACHAFAVTASPDHVDEGGTVTVTVSRDAAVSPSNVDVSSVNGTATGDQDFPAVHRTISFTTDTKQNFTVPITDDGAAEPAESFRLHLSNPGGCAINPNFTLGPDATVTISANDAATTTVPPATTAPTTQPTTAVGSASRSTTSSSAAPVTTSPSPATSTGAAVTSSATTTSTLMTREVAASDSGSDSSAPAVLIVIAILVAAGAAGASFYLLRRRRSLS